MSTLLVSRGGHNNLIYTKVFECCVSVVVCWYGSVGGSYTFWITVCIIPGWTQHPTVSIRSCQSTFQEYLSRQRAGKEIWFCLH